MRSDAITIKSGAVFHDGERQRRWYWCCLLSGEQPGTVRPCGVGDALTWLATWYAVKAHALGRHGVDLDAPR